MTGREGDERSGRSGGVGGFKSVYRAANRGGPCPAPVVALGFPHQEDSKGIAELEKEFAVTSRLVHPNILRVFAVAQHDGPISVSAGAETAQTAAGAQTAS